MNHYDFIIAGGGVAGLSLAYHLIQSPLRDAKMLIIDRSDKTRNDRTLSFWSSQTSPFDDLAHHTWKRLRLASEGFERIATLDTYHYATVRALDFYQHVHQALAAFPNITFLRGQITQIDDSASLGCVWVDGEPYYGQWIFDSCFNQANFQPNPKRYHALEQHFHGWVIETDQPTFDPELPTLMDFRTPQHGDMRFFYVIPYSETQALIEYVLMRPDQYQPAMEAYIKDVLGICDYRILSKEGGISPLTDYPFPRRVGDHHMAIGTAGGRVKPSSGYAFTRIQADSTAIIASLLAHKHPFDVPDTPSHYRLYDRLMLEVMQQHGNAMRPIFTAMLKHNPLERIFRLLDESASFWEMLLITASVPPQYFIEALVHLMTLRER